ncbi:MULTISPECIES: hypothetical protein [unclassified Rhizobium]|uniref:hypothetical protein n=1 Tax=unclassified Rhizobium TaxID=2613769 RepID=UPI001ADD4A12|nr:MULTISPECIES: hypothetical protein [unclassified Rhizobium]MBO9125698.1 hypothetical protein [Rhizobium sp. 16-488-2b]MBO9176282.1 hypothetical protein [Rhizobium sp. 16-488-2a]
MHERNSAERSLAKSHVAPEFVLESNIPLKLKQTRKNKLNELGASLPHCQKQLFG